MDVIHATPAAGHLSSASIYPACLAPYILATACSDSTLRYLEINTEINLYAYIIIKIIAIHFFQRRFWKCNVTKKDNDEFEYTWKEWEMMNKDQESTIDIPGEAYIEINLYTNIYKA